MQLNHEEAVFIGTVRHLAQAIEGLDLPPLDAMRVLDHLRTAEQIVVANAAIKQIDAVMPDGTGKAIEQESPAQIKARKLREKFGVKYEQNENNSDSPKREGDSKEGA